jgi:hypothetical protein
MPIDHAKTSQPRATDSKAAAKEDGLNSFVRTKESNFVMPTELKEVLSAVMDGIIDASLQTAHEAELNVVLGAALDAVHGEPQDAAHLKAVRDACAVARQAAGDGVMQRAKFMFESLLHDAALLREGAAAMNMKYPAVEVPTDPKEKADFLKRVREQWKAEMLGVF